MGRQESTKLILPLRIKNRRIKIIINFFSPLVPSLKCLLLYIINVLLVIKPRAYLAFLCFLRWSFVEAEWTTPTIKNCWHSEDFSRHLKHFESHGGMD